MAAVEHDGCRLLHSALDEAMARFGRPEITGKLKGGRDQDIDGWPRTLDRQSVRRTALWPSLKYECVYLHAFEIGSEARRGIGLLIGYQR